MVYENLNIVDLSTVFNLDENFNYKLDILYKDYLKLNIETNPKISGYENPSNFCFVNISTNSLLILKMFIERIKSQNDEISKLLHVQYEKIKSGKSGSWVELMVEIFKINPNLVFFRKNSITFSPAALKEGDPVEMLNFLVEYTNTSDLFIWNVDFGINNEVPEGLNSPNKFLTYINSILDGKTLKNKYLLLNFTIDYETLIFPFLNINNSIFVLSSIGLGTNKVEKGSTGHYQTIYRVSKNKFRFISDLKYEDVTFKQIYTSKKVRYLIYEYWGEKNVQTLLLSGLEPKRIEKFIKGVTPVKLANGVEDGEQIEDENFEVESNLNSIEDDEFIDDKLTKDFLKAQLNVEPFLGPSPLNYEEFSNYTGVIDIIDDFEDVNGLEAILPQENVNYNPLLNMVDSFSNENKRMSTKMINYLSSLDDLENVEDSDGIGDFITDVESQDEESEESSDDSYDDDPIVFMGSEAPIYREDYEASKQKTNKTGRKKRRRRKNIDPDYNPDTTPSPPKSPTFYQKFKMPNHKVPRKLLFDSDNFVELPSKTLPPITLINNQARLYQNKNEIEESIEVPFINPQKHLSPELDILVSESFKINFKKLKIKPPSNTLSAKIISSLKRNPLIPRYHVHPYVRGLIHYINLLKARTIRHQYDYKEAIPTDSTFPLTLRANIFTEVFRLNKLNAIETLRYHFNEPLIPRLMKRRRKIKITFTASNKFDSFINQVKMLKVELK